MPKPDAVTIQGVQVGVSAMLLEKSLAMMGKVVESKAIWQGRPASFWKEHSDKKDGKNKDKTVKVLKGSAQTDESSITEESNNANAASLSLVRSNRLDCGVLSDGFICLVASSRLTRRHSTYIHALPANCKVVVTTPRQVFGDPGH